MKVNIGEQYSPWESMLYMKKKRIEIAYISFRFSDLMKICEKSFTNILCEYSRLEERRGK